MKKSILLRMIFMAAIAILTVSSCIYDPNNVSNGNGSVVPGGNDDGSKITALTLSDVIKDAKDGDVIDLSNSEYVNITNYNATIDKAVTIRNRSLKDCSLTIVTDGVVLTNVHNANVSTNSSMRISRSTLGSLNINSSVNGSNGSQIVGRGNSTESKIPPIIEISDSTVSNLDVGIKKTFVKAENLTSTKVVMSAEDTQLSVLDKDSEIKGISFSKPCQIILEDGSNDKIAAPKATNSAAGEAVQIKMKSSMSLIRLAAASGIPSVIMEGTIPDFSSLTVYGTYSATDGVTVYKPGDFCYEGAKQFTKLESQFTVKIDGVVYFENGNKASTAVPLGEGEKTVSISISGVENPKYEFTINVVKSEPVLVSIAIENLTDILNHGNIYRSGEVFSLKGLKVTGHYRCADNSEYDTIVTGWQSEPADGDKLNSDKDKLNVFVDTPSGRVSISDIILLTIKDSFAFTFVPDVNNEHYNFMQFVVKDETAEEPSAFTLEGYEGYEFLGWWTSHNNGVTLDATYDFSSSVTADTKVYAKWNKPIERKSDDGDENTEDQTPDTPSEGTYRIVFSAGDSVEYNGTMDAIDVTCDVTVDLPQCTFINIHNKFKEWNTSKDGTGASYADKAQVINLALAGETVTLWARWESAEKYRIIYHKNEFDNTTTMVQVIYTDSTSGDLVILDWPSEWAWDACYIFSNWTTKTATADLTYDVGYPISEDLTGDGGEVHLYAEKTPRTWTIEYKDQGGAPYSGTDNTSDWADKFVYGDTPIDLNEYNPSKQYYTFDRWYVDADCTTSVGTINDDYVFNNCINSDTITLYAKWTPITYTIQFYANNGESDDPIDDPITQDMTYDVSEDLSQNTFTFNFMVGSVTCNRTFLGWSTTAQPIGNFSVMYTDGQKVSNLGSDPLDPVTLYAVWSAAAGDIVYSNGDGSGYSLRAENNHLSSETAIGVVFDVTADKIKIVHLDESTDTMAWCLSNANGYNYSFDTSSDDGSVNWDIICGDVSDSEISGNYPAFEYVNSLTEDGGNWYLPAINELSTIMSSDNKTIINNTLDIFGTGHRISSADDYWSSTDILDQDEPDALERAWYYKSMNSQPGGGLKSESFHVRAVKAIDISSFITP